MLLILTAILLLRVSQSQLFFISSPSTVTVISPSGYTTINEKYHNDNQNNYIGDNAQWVWVDGPSYKVGTIFTLETIFYSPCNQSQATLMITADGYIITYINDVFIGMGRDWHSTTMLVFDLIQGNNILKNVFTVLPETNPAIIYSLQHGTLQTCLPTPPSTPTNNDNANTSASSNSNLIIILAVSIPLAVIGIAIISCRALRKTVKPEPTEITDSAKQTQGNALGLSAEYVEDCKEIRKKRRKYKKQSNFFK